MRPTKPITLLQPATPSPSVLFAVSLGTGLSLIGDVSLYTVLPTHTAEVGVSVASVGILLSANRFIRLLLNGPAGFAYDRWSPRFLFILSLMIGVFSTALYALSAGFWLLLIARLLWGAAWSGIWVGGNAIVLNTAGAVQRGRWLGLYNGSFFLGAAVGALLGGLMTDWFGYHLAMAINAGLTLLGTLVVWWFLPVMRSGPLVTRSGPPVPLEDPPAPQRLAEAPPPATRPLELASVAALMGVNRIVMAGILTSTLGLFLLEQLGDGLLFNGRAVGVATLTGLGLALTTLIGMFIAPIAGSLSDRAGNRWRVAAGGLLPGVAGFSLLAASSPLAILLGLPLTAVTSGSNQSLTTAIMGDLSGRRRYGRSLGFLFTIGDLASAIGPPLAYFLIPYVGINNIYFLAAVLFGLMFFISLPWTIK